MDVPSDDLPGLSIVVPVYRSAEILPALVMRVEEVLRGMGRLGEAEIVLVDDASPDNSWETIRKLATDNPRIRGVGLRKNVGQHNATMAGLNHARGRHIVIMDDDLQHPPEAIPKLLEALDSRFDVCYTNYLGRKHPLWKRLGSAFNNGVATALLDKPRGLYLSSFKALTREIAQEVVKYDGPYAYLDGLILEVTRLITSVDIEHERRLVGLGNYNLRRSISLWLKMITSFSITPLRLVALTGVCLAAISGIVLVFVAVYKLLHPDIPAGWSSLLAAIVLVGGVQLMGMGIIGEYLGRTYVRLNRKPQFIVRERTWDLRAPRATTFESGREVLPAHSVRPMRGGILEGVPFPSRQELRDRDK